MRWKSVCGAARGVDGREGSETLRMRLETISSAGVRLCQSVMYVLREGSCWWERLRLKYAIREKDAEKSGEPASGEQTLPERELPLSDASRESSLSPSTMRASAQRADATQAELEWVSFQSLSTSSAAN